MQIARMFVLVLMALLQHPLTASHGQQETAKQ
jgi:hypothetical protein